MIKIWWKIEKPFKTDSPTHKLGGEKTRMNKTNKTYALITILILTLSLGGIYMVSAETEEEDIAIAPLWMPRRGFGPMFGSLDDPLMEELKETVQTMRDEGVTREEIREYIQDFLEENGIEPVKPELNEEQLALMKQLHEEVREFAQQRAEELGLEMSGKDFIMRPRMGFKGFCHRNGHNEPGN